MKVDKKIVVEFLKAVRRNFAPDEVGENNAYYMDDATVLLTPDNKLVGIAFETLGQSFNILNTLDLLMSVDDDTDDTYIVDDEGMIDLIEGYLSWRTKVLFELEL